MNKTSVLLTAAVLAAPAFAQGTDDCAAPTALAANGAFAFDTTVATTSGFDGGAACGAGSDTINQDLFWAFTVPATGDYRFDTQGSSYDTKLSVHTGADCTAICAGYNDDTGGLQSTVDLFGLNMGDVILVQVGGFGTASGLGTLNVGAIPPICGTIGPDAFEDNDDCGSAVALGDGTYAGLNVDTNDNDYFLVGLDAGATLDASIFFIDFDGDVDLYLWDPAVECDTNVAGTGGAFLVRGFTASDDETITYTNMTGAAQTLVLEVDMFTSPACNTYDLQIAGSNGMPGGTGIGTAYCMANVNSTGVASSITATGSTNVVDNDVTLSATDLPTNAFGFFIASQSQGFVPNPGGSSGNLCVGGAIGRYVGPGQIMSSGAAGEIALAIDVTAIPQPTGPVGAAAGESWNFQLWHRDLVGGATTSNFTNGTEVTFQ